MKLYGYFFFIVILMAYQKVFPQGGLKFCGGRESIEKRTSYNVFGNKPVVFSGHFKIEFKLSLFSKAQIGYIIRIKDEKNNEIYNLFYDGQGEKLTFKFNEEGKNVLITAEIDKEELLNVQWFDMVILFDMENDLIRLTIHQRTFEAQKTGLPDRCFPIIVFGKSEHIIDVPSFAIKDVEVGNHEKYFFALRESEGNTVHDSQGKPIGETINPVWLINDAYHWRFMDSFKMRTVAGTNYNPNKKEIYYFSRDSILIYNIMSGEVNIEIFKEQCPVKLKLGTNFIDTNHEKLYVYEVYDDVSSNGECMVASLDLLKYGWKTESYDRLPMQLHHHGSYFEPYTHTYMIFGGFGNMKYNKDLYSFDLHSREWHILKGFTGDIIIPRYFNSVGYFKETNSIYVFGGMGNESGEQVVGRKYLYDLHRVDLTTNHVTKLWEMPWNKNNIVPVRGMVVLNDSCFYTLCYPEHFTDSYLRLYQFSLKDGNYKILGDSIPIHSDKITTNANLYYDVQLNNLYAIIQEFDDDIVSTLKVYSLTFPPITAEYLKSYPKKRNNNILWTVMAAFFMCGIVISCAIYRCLKTRRAGSPNNSWDERIPDNDCRIDDRPNSICLFGEFTVRDRHSKDITYMFSARLRKTFCVILQYSMDQGITSQRLSNLLWPGKPEDKVKNSRGVTINHLRRTLRELDGIELMYDKGYFKIILDEACYCDYIRCIQIISSNRIDKNRQELIGILIRGKFLEFFDDPLFDSFKDESEQKLEPVLLMEIKKSFESGGYQATLDFANAIFNIDPLNEEALVYQIKTLHKLKMDEEVGLKYREFVINYKKMIGVEYSRHLKDII